MPMEVDWEATIWDAFGRHFFIFIVQDYCYPFSSAVSEPRITWLIEMLPEDDFEELIENPFCSISSGSESAGKAHT